MTLFSRWFKRTLNDPQIMLLVLVLLGAFVLLSFLSDALAPVIAAVVIAFLLDGPSNWLQRRGMGALMATSIMFLSFVAVLILGLVLVLPPLTGQVVQFVDLLPKMVERLRDVMLKLPQTYPGLVTESFVRDIMDTMTSQLTGMGKEVVTRTLTGVTSVVVLGVYAILVSVMVFFFMKDKHKILGWLGGFLPIHRPLADRVWDEVVARAGDYARGKAYEILIVGTVAWIVYTVLGLRFPALLAVMTGLSVIVPYVGATVVTFPVAFVAFFQWGVGSEFFMAVGAYLLLQALDGNLLAPLLFSEVVKLHPNAIILAVLVFGTIWGVWGVFFAIPLATLAHAVIKAWPRQTVIEKPGMEEGAARDLH